MVPKFTLHWFTEVTEKLKFFNMNCLKWVTGLSNYLEQVAATHTLPNSFYLVFQNMLFLKKTIHGKYDLNIKDFICFSHPAKNLRSSKFINHSPVKSCHKIKTQESYFQRVCCYSNSSIISTASFTFLINFIFEYLSLTKIVHALGLLNALAASVVLDILLFTL